MINFNAADYDGATARRMGRVRDREGDRLDRPKKGPKKTGNWFLWGHAHRIVGEIMESQTWT